ncbi:MAG TPA: DUF327 family protein [Spirochaetia bacterium]|nr:DUF327 family protein [Spirochaetia bacterium]
MSKINPADFSNNAFLHTQAAREKKQDKTKQVFRKLFTTIHEKSETTETAPTILLPDDQETAIEELLDLVHSSGDALRKNISTTTIQAYKAAVKRFTSYIINTVYAIEEKNSSKNLLKRKKYTQIAIIDEKLEHFAAEILSSQRDKLDILARLDEIYGLLIDLLY